MSELFVPARIPPADGNGAVYAGFTYEFFDADTDAPKTVYTTKDLTTAHPLAVPADADGLPPAIFPGTGDYYYVMKDSAGATIYTSPTLSGAPEAAGAVSAAPPSMPVTVLNTTTTLTTSDYGKKFLLDATGGDFDVFVPTAVDSNGLKVNFQKSSNGGTITLKGVSGQTINGSASIAMSNFNDFANLTADGANHSAALNDTGDNSVSLTDLDDSVTGYLNVVGAVSAWPVSAMPAGHLECDGSSLLRSEYPQLFTAIGDWYGAADSLHFNIPDYRGLGLRGHNNGRTGTFSDLDAATRTLPGVTGETMTAGDNVGTYQDDQIKAHVHDVRTAGTAVREGGAFSTANNTTDEDSGSFGGLQTHGKNAAVKWMIFASPELASGASGTLNRVITVTGAPGAGDGVDGDYAVNTGTTPNTFYGPKASGAWPAGNPMGTINRGAWVLSTSYNANEVVTNDGSSYISKSSHTSSSTDEPGVGANTATYWDVLAAKGDDGANGADGTNGSNGTNGTDGATGPAGPVLGIGWTFSATTTDSDPGSGVIRLNNGTLGSVTEIYIDNEDRNGTSVTSTIDSWYASTSVNKSQLELIDPAAPDTNYAVFNVTAGADSTGYRTLTVSHFSSAGILPDGAEVVVAWHNVGDAGTGAVTSFNGRSGAVVPVANDYAVADVDGLATALAGKAASSHNHAAGDVTSGTFADARISESSVTQHIDADTLYADTDDTLTAGFATTSADDGTKSSGTYTPAAAGGNIKEIINGGAFTLAAPTLSGTIVIEVTNNGSAGSVTTSGFTAESGDALTTTDGDDFIMYITKTANFSHLHIQALQ